MSKSQDKKKRNKSVIVSDEILIFNQVQRLISNYNLYIIVYIRLKIQIKYTVL